MHPLPVTSEGAPPATLLAAIAFHPVEPPPHPQPSPSIVGEPLSDARWDALLREVRGRRLSGFLLAGIADGAVAATSSQADEAQQAHAAALRWCMLLEHCLLEAVARLAGAGIEHRVLKGPAMAHLVYRPPSVRTFFDIDLLVPPHQFEPALHVLADAGYRRVCPELRPGFDRAFSKAVTLVGPRDVQIDLHRTLAFGRFGLHIDAGQLFDEPSPLVVSGTSLLALGPERRFLHACYHAALTPESGRLLSLRDVAEMLAGPPLDASMVRDLATSWRGVPVVAVVLGLLRDRTGRPTPPELAWAVRHRIRPADRRALRATGTGGEAIGALPAIAGLGPRLRFLSALAAPDRAFLRHRGHRGYLSWWGRGAWKAVANRRPPVGPRV
jgi:hypothetical protein